MSKLKIGIIGGAGYTGGELIRLLINHPDIDIQFINSSSNAGNPVYAVHKDLIGDTELKFTNAFDDSAIDVLFLCSGHGDSKKFVDAHNIRPEVKIIDLSQDYRIVDPEASRDFTYGLCEAEADKVKSAGNIANPGCFATGIQLGLYPLAVNGELKSEIHISATTGSTGAGQKPTGTSHFSWRNNNISIYKAFNHQHLLEINQSLKRWDDNYNQKINFLPYRGNFARGILSAIYLKSDLSEAAALDLFNKAYGKSRFVHMSEANIDLKQVVNTNKGLVFVEKHDDTLLVVTAIDNLLKGASGQAVQNMNIMCGLDEDAGLKIKPSAF